MSDLREEIEKVIKKFLEEEAIALWEKSIGNGTELFTLVQAIEGDEASISNMSFDMANSILSIVEKRDESKPLTFEKRSICDNGFIDCPKTKNNQCVSNCSECYRKLGEVASFIFCSNEPQPPKEQ